MRCRVGCACAVVLFGVVASPVMAAVAGTSILRPVESIPAETADTATEQAIPPAAVYADPETGDGPPVVLYDLSGPRIGVTFMPSGIGPRSQFGWHFENQASAGARGPRFLVERIFLVGGVEKGEFIPSGTLVFGVRTRDGSEFGIGPSVTLGPQGFTTAVVVAAGQSLRYGGINVPVNLAVAMSNRGNVTTYRVTLITGWAIRQPEPRPSPPYRYGLE